MPIGAVILPVVSRRAEWWDVALYGGSAAMAAIAATSDHIPLHRDWGRLAAGPYFAGAALALVLAVRRSRPDPRRLLRVRAAIAAAVFAGAVLLPVAVKVGLRARDGARFHVQSEAILTEEGARVLLAGRNPYAASYRDSPVGGWPPAVWLHVPYLPGNFAFGVPRALGGEHALTDARVAFLGVALAAAALALARSRAPADRRLRVLMVLVVLPTGARYLTGGGNDITVLSLMLGALLLLDRGRPAAAGAVAGLAAAIKQTAWPLLPFLVIAARHPDGRPARGHAALAAGAVLLPVVTPFALWDPAAFIDDVIRFPLGLADEASLAGGPTLGRVLLGGLPRGVVIAVLASIVLGAGAFLLLRRPPASAGAAAERAAALTLISVVLATAGRFGYLIYPLNLLVWSRLLLRSESRLYGGAKTAGSVSRRRRLRNSTPSDAAATKPAITSASPGSTRNTS